MKNKILIITALIFFLVFVLVDSHAFAAFTFTTNAITGTAASTIDLGSGNALALQTSGGNLGIGDPAPTIPLSVVGTDSGSGLASFLYPGLASGSLMFISFGKAAVADQRGNLIYGYNTTAASQVISLGFAGHANTFFNVLESGNVGIGTGSPTGKLSVIQAATATGALKGIVYTGAVNTNQTLSTEIPSLTLTTAGRQWATGALTTQREVLITQPTYSFVGGSTITDAATVGIAGAPIAGTNATLTNSHGLLIQPGAVASGTTTSYGLTVNAQTGASGNNYAAQFLGGNVGVGTSSPSATLDVKGHVASSQTTIPTTSVTGTGFVAGTIGTGSTDTKGTVTATVGANVGTVVVTFNTSYTTAPVCTVTPATATAQVDVVKMFATSGTGALTLNFVASPTGGSETFNYICLQ